MDHGQGRARRPRLHAAPRARAARSASKDLKGKTVVLYFYPKDDTPGCTREACAFRDTQAAIKKKGAVVLGVSGDSLAAHEKFKAKYKLNFPLLSDPDKAVAKKYGAWGEKVMYGKKVMGMIRSTFVIDEGGYREQGLPASPGGRARREGARGRSPPFLTPAGCVRPRRLPGREAARAALGKRRCATLAPRARAPRWWRPWTTACSPRESACGPSSPSWSRRYCAGDPESVLPAACAIEMVHTASLILDDLPCMDDAHSPGAGGPTCHVAHGEATAILAAFALQNRAFEILGEGWPGGPDASVRAGLTRDLARAIGLDGMIAGQAADLEMTDRVIDFQTLEFIHSRKTGALFIGLGGARRRGGSRRARGARGGVGLREEPGPRLPGAWTTSSTRPGRGGSRARTWART